ncbi:Uma2 family endonuclease [Trichothermofontia sichuanensis B231]|uniref:Uma2 family endonuclease n=1 Tax=Trichothermofontia sichuanensis TaxID=3045816 RepID=UPI0022474D1D|nr:Uma2 family endonuclease [Trichothermofontia sichuanensis]UZQ54516.1 Uma2 family endonuclease [Trichothermofontia sichuanensis B231]
MVTTKLTLTDYLALNDDFEGRREFVDGEIIEMPTESPQNLLISLFLLAQFLQLVPIEQLRRMDTELLVASRVRIPDLMILGPALATVLLASGRSIITEDMPAPLLAVEVVSPGKVNEDRDYRFKRSEYAARGIPEYWIIDPMRALVRVLTLVDGLYESVDYRHNDRIQSSVLPELNLTVEQLLCAGNSS